MATKVDKNTVEECLEPADDALIIRGLAAVVEPDFPLPWTELRLEYRGRQWRVCIAFPQADEYALYEYEVTPKGERRTAESGDILRGDYDDAIGSAILSAVFFAQEPPGKFDADTQ